MTRNSFIGALFAAAAIASQPAHAQAGASSPADGSPGLVRLLDCQKLAAAADRLACFDREAATMRTAVDRHDVVLLDAGKVEKSRRSMFGLSNPDDRILKRNVKSSTPFVAIDSTIRAVVDNGYGHYQLTFESGAVWRNVDLLDTLPPIGTKVHVDKTPFGAYLLKMPNFQSVHAVRVR